MSKQENSNPNAGEDLISIIIPTYNRRNFIIETINSVLAQTYKNFEIVIVDDASTDDTKNMLKDLGILNYHNLKYIMLDENKGATYARHIGIVNCNGTFYVPLDSDDLITQDYLEKMHKFILDTKADFVYCDTIYFDKLNKFYYKQPEYNFFNLIQNNFISYASLFRKEVYLKVLYNLDNRNYQEDYELYLRLGRYGYYGKHLGESLFLHRNHSNSITGKDFYNDFNIIVKCYFIVQMPEIFPEDWKYQALNKLKNFPENFIKMKWEEIVKYVKP